MSLDYSCCYCQPQAGASGLGRIPRPEDLLLQIGRDPRPGVGDAHLDVAVATAGLHQQLAAAGAAFHEQAVPTHEPDVHRELLEQLGSGAGVLDEGRHPRAPLRYGCSTRFSRRESGREAGEALSGRSSRRRLQA